MKKFLSLIICTFLLASISFPNVAFAATVYEIESNDTFSTANTIAVGNVLNGRISATSDSDVFKLQCSSNLSARIMLSNIPSSCDYDLKLYDSIGNQIGSSTNGSSTNETIGKGLTGGTYYIKVFSRSGSSNNYYKLSVTNADGTPIREHGGDVYEYNDRFSLATDSGQGSMGISEANIHPLGDIDYYKFNVSKKCSALVSLAAPSPDLRYNFAVYDSNYNFMGSGSGTSDCTLTLTSGTYYIKVYGVDCESVLNYRLRMTIAS